MIKIALNHFIINAGISAFFDNVIKSFTKPKYTKWLEDPDSFIKAHPKGSIIIADISISLIQPPVDYYIPRYECIVLHHFPVGVDSNFRLMVNIPDIVTGRHIAIYNVSFDRWEVEFGTFQDMFTEEFKQSNREDFY